MEDLSKTAKVEKAALARAQRVAGACLAAILVASFLLAKAAPSSPRADKLQGPLPAEASSKPAERLLLEPPGGNAPSLDQRGDSSDGEMTPVAALAEPAAAQKGRPRITAFVDLSPVVAFDKPGVSDPTTVYFKGYYVTAFTRNAVNRVHLAISRGGDKWVLADLALPRFQWASLFVHAGQLYVIGPEGDLWARRKRGIPNDLQLARVDFEGPGHVHEAGRTKLTQGMGVHILNNVPAILNDTVYFPIMIAPASTRWQPLPVRGFAVANATALDQGMHAVDIEGEGEEVQLGALDWDAGVFGVVVGEHRLGKGVFVRLEQATTNATVYARVLWVDAATLWVVPQKWHADCRAERQDWACKSSLGGAGAAPRLRAGTGWAVWPDSPIFQEFLLAVMQSVPGGDLLDPASWSMSRLVGNPIMAYPQAHKLWAGPSVQERSVDGALRRCTGTGARECIYWQEPVAFVSKDGASIAVAVRLTTDQNCNSALLCSLGAGAGADGELACDKFAGVPGFGNVRGWVVFDAPSGMYWAVNNFNLDTTSGGTGKTFLRVGQRCFNQRGNVGLFYSGDMHNWVLAKVLTRANSNVLSLHYVSCNVVGEDLLCVGRTNGDLQGAGAIVAGNARNHHVSRLIVSWRVASFRTLMH